MTVHFRPLDPSEPPSIGENLAHHTIVVSLPTVGGLWDEHEISTEEAHRVATLLADHGPFRFVDVLGVEVETDLLARYAARLVQRLRDASSAADVFARLYPKAVAR